MLLTALNQEASEQCSQHPAPSTQLPARRTERQQAGQLPCPQPWKHPGASFASSFFDSIDTTALPSILPGSEEHCQEGFSTLEGTVLCSLRLRSCEQTRPKKSVKFKLGLDYEP